VAARGGGRALSAAASVRVRRAVSELLRAIGEDPARPGLAETPRLVAEALPELFCGVGEDPGDAVRVIAADGDSAVRISDLPFLSWCEHHLLPFHGLAAVAYLPDGGRIAGLGDVARALRVLSRRPQLQERLTAQLADVLYDRLAPRWLEVEIEATQLCLTARGANAAGARVVTRARRGEAD
jgi:GTP cyclohydrolase I